MKAAEVTSVITLCRRCRSDNPNHADGPNRSCRPLQVEHMLPFSGKGRCRERLRTYWNIRRGVVAGPAGLEPATSR